jgi:hypothetical protein
LPTVSGGGLRILLLLQVELVFLMSQLTLVSLLGFVRFLSEIIGRALFSPSPFHLSFQSLGVFDPRLKSGLLES